MEGNRGGGEKIESGWDVGCGKVRGFGTVGQGQEKVDRGINVQGVGCHGAIRGDNSWEVVCLR